MKKIAIITLTGNDNYGNRLQNYALQQALTKKGFLVETIWREKEQKKNIVLILYNIKEFIKEFYRSLIEKNNILKLKKIRKSKFLEFMNYLKLSSFESKGIIPKYVNEMYDYFVVGSDQVWNYNFADVNSNNFLLFADYDKTLSYAASFGINDIEMKWEKTYIKYLNHIKNISVRELAGQKIIKKLLNKDVPVVLDPTLLLDKKDWNVVIKNVKLKLPKKYLLVYFLGSVTDIIKKEIVEYAHNINIEVVCLKGWNNDFYYNCGPSEFVYLFKNATFVITDSFHGTAFSIIYEKDFLVFDRNTKANMNSRIDSILKLLEIEERHTSKLKILDSINYCEVNKKLKKLIKKSNEYIDNSIKE